MSFQRHLCLCICLMLLLHPSSLMLRSQSNLPCSPFPWSFSLFFDTQINIHYHQTLLYNILHMPLHLLFSGSFFALFLPLFHPSFCIGHWWLFYLSPPGSNHNIHAHTLFCPFQKDLFLMSFRTVHVPQYNLYIHPVI